MTTERSIIEAVRSELARKAWIGAHAHHLSLDCRDGVLFLAGEVDSVAVKKQVLEQAAAIQGVVGIVDRLQVAPAARMGDGEVARLLGDSLVAENAFSALAITAAEGAKPPRLLQDPPVKSGSISFRVADGVVTLNGEVRALDQKRLAGVLAWWIPGARDVINGIAVEPPDREDDATLADAIRIVLEKDPLVEAAGIRVVVTGGTAVLSGSAPTEGQRAMAENDAWCVFGVDHVVNRLSLAS